MMLTLCLNTRTYRNPILTPSISIGQTHRQVKIGHWQLTYSKTYNIEKRFPCLCQDARNWTGVHVLFNGNFNEICVLLTVGGGCMLRLRLDPSFVL